MTWTTTQRDVLKDAIAKGIKTVKYADGEVTYQDLKEMRALLADMEQDIAVSAGRKSVSYAGFDRE